MLTTAQVYKIYLEETEKIFKRFKEVDLEHFYYTEKEDSWSPEMLFRHLIMSSFWMLSYLPGEELQPSSLALREGTFPRSKASIEEVEQELNNIAKIIFERMEKLTPDAEEEEINAWQRNIPRQIVIVRVIQHDYTHIGQINWLFKRSTDWTDRDVYKEFYKKEN